MDAAMLDFIAERVAAEPERWAGLSFHSVDGGGYWIYVESVETGEQLGSIDRPTLFDRARAKMPPELTLVASALARRTEGDR